MDAKRGQRTYKKPTPMQLPMRGHVWIEASIGRRSGAPAALFEKKAGWRAGGEYRTCLANAFAQPSSGIVR